MKERPMWSRHIQLVDDRAKKIAEETDRAITRIVRKMRSQGVPWKDIEITLSHAIVVQPTFERLFTGQMKMPKIPPKKKPKYTK